MEPAWSIDPTPAHLVGGGSVRTIRPPPVPAGDSRNLQRRAKKRTTRIRRELKDGSTHRSYRSRSHTADTVALSTSAHRTSAFRASSPGTAFAKRRKQPDRNRSVVVGNTAEAGSAKRPALRQLVSRKVHLRCPRSRRVIPRTSEATSERLSDLLRRLYGAFSWLWYPLFLRPSSCCGPPARHLERSARSNRRPTPPPKTGQGGRRLWQAERQKTTVVLGPAARMCYGTCVESVDPGVTGRDYGISAHRAP